MSEVVQIYSMIQEMRDSFENKWTNYKSFALQGGRIDSNTLEIKQAEDKICGKIQKEMRRMFPEELARVTRE